MELLNKPRLTGADFNRNKDRISMRKRTPFIVGFYLVVVSQIAFCLPAWVENPSADDDKFIYGVGSGEAFDSAKKGALTDIAGKFNTRVKERIVAQHKQENDQTSARIQIDTESEIAATNLSHFQVINSEREGELFWVEARLDKQAFASDIRDRWKHLDATLEQEMEALESVSTLEQLLRVNGLIQKNLSLQVVLAQLSFAASNFAVDSHYQRYRQFLRQLNGIADGHSVSLVAENVPEPIKSLINSTLTERGLTLKETRARAAKGTAIHVSTNSSAEKDERDAYRLKLTLNLRCTSDTGDTIGTSSYSVRGRSYNNEKEAMEKAVAALKIKFRKLSLIDMLNIGVGS